MKAPMNLDMYSVRTSFISNIARKCLSSRWLVFVGGNIASEDGFTRATRL